MAQVKTANPKRVFLVVWLSQFVSALGTGLIDFALGVFVYQRTGSATQFALVLVFAMVPAILLSPFSGALADRWDRRGMMLVSEAACGVVILALTLLQHGHGLEVWHVYVAVVLLAVGGAFRDPAYYASVSQMVPKRQLGRASGLVQTAENIGMVAPPLIAGFLMAAVGVSGVLLIDLISYTVGILALLVVVFPPVERPEDADSAKPTLWADMAAGWAYMMRHRGFLHLFLFGSFISFSIGLTQIVVTPLLLSFTSAAVLGATFSAGGFGMFLGGAVMAAWGGPKNKVAGVLLFGLAQALCLFLVGLRPNPVVIGAGLFGCLFSIQFVRGCTAAVIRTHVPDAMQARVFALNRFVAWSTLPLAYLVAGPLVKVFNPLLEPSGSLADSVGKILAVGSGRGIGLLLIVLGGAFLLVVLGNYANPRLRNIEAEMTAQASERTALEETGARG
ncbi:MFS transporter [Kitasatospora sp. NBC_00374]|uniref:MFS transporter n=1 Tax=Kitasatospora sp. NBC_00374 TaxID=2975964 RepID=UPI0032523964